MICFLFFSFFCCWMERPSECYIRVFMLYIGTLDFTAVKPTRSFMMHCGMCVNVYTVYSVQCTVDSVTKQSI